MQPGIDTTLDTVVQSCTVPPRSLFYPPALLPLPLPKATPSDTFTDVVPVRHRACSDISESVKPGVGMTYPSLSFCVFREVDQRSNMARRIETRGRNKNGHQRSMRTEERGRHTWKVSGPDGARMVQTVKSVGLALVLLDCRT
jgi:hypothetical protein